MDWQLFTRDQYAAATGGIPAIKADAVTRRIATGKFVVEVPYTPDRWARLSPACGLIIRRGGQGVLSGAWTRRAWRGPTAEYPAGTIALEGVTDDVIGAHRLCAPDPTKPLDQQSTVATWTRGPLPVETIMHALVTQNCGPSALEAVADLTGASYSRRVPGLVMGVDQGRGPVVTWSTLRYASVQSELQRLSAYAEARGVRLLPKFHQTELGLTFEVLEAVDRSGGADQPAVVFGPGLGNIDDQEYTEDAGTVGVAIGAGKGEGVMRMQRARVTRDEFTRLFGTLSEAYEDRRDTDAWEELEKAAQEAVDKGVASVSFRCTALDTPGTRYGEDFDLNTRASVEIGPPGIDPVTGQPYQPIASFSDLVRELHFKYDPSSSERPDVVTAAVGTESATTNVALPSLKKIAALNAQITQLQRSQ